MPGKKKNTYISKEDIEILLEDNDDEFVKEYEAIAEAYFLDYEVNNPQGSENSRWSCFKNALNKGWSEAKLNQVLSEKKLRKLYLNGTVHESLLFACVKINECNTQKKFNWEAYKKLLAYFSARLKADLKPKDYPVQTAEIKTFHDLKTFLEQNTPKKKDAEEYETRTHTVYLESEKFGKLDYTKDNILDEVYAIILENIRESSASSITGRYYFFKYLYFSIIHQVEEFKEILRNYALSGFENSAAKLKSREFRNRWSLYDQTADNLRRAAAAERSDEIYTKKYITLRTSDRMMLTGFKDKYKKTYFPETPEKREAILKEISKITPDFFGAFPLSNAEIFDSLFLYEYNVDDRTDPKRKYITPLRTGKISVSRTALIMALFSARQMLDIPIGGKDFATLYEENYDPENRIPYQKITVSRIGSILQRCGYPELSASEKNPMVDFDRIILDLLDPNKNNEARISAFTVFLRNFYDEYDVNLLPLELPRKHTEKILAEKTGQSILK